jgi:hypothetical protein
MIKKKQVIGAAAFFAVMALSVGFFALAADLGGKENPLVTLDYLKSLDPQIEETIAEAVRKQVEAQMDEIDDMIRRAGSVSGGGVNTNDPDFIDQIAAAIAGQIGAGTGPLESTVTRVTYNTRTDVTLKPGQSILLRGNNGTLKQCGNPGLINITDGDVLSSGGTLKVNHKYFNTTETDRVIDCPANTTVFLWKPVD